MNVDKDFVKDIASALCSSRVQVVPHCGPCVSTLHKDYTPDPALLIEDYLPYLCTSTNDNDLIHIQPARYQNYVQAFQGFIVREGSQLDTSGCNIPDTLKAVWPTVETSPFYVRTLYTVGVNFVLIMVPVGSTTVDFVDYTPLGNTKAYYRHSCTSTRNFFAVVTSDVYVGNFSNAISYGNTISFVNSLPYGTGSVQDEMFTALYLNNDFLGDCLQSASGITIANAFSCTTDGYPDFLTGTIKKYFTYPPFCVGYKFRFYNNGPSTGDYLTSVAP